MTGAASDRCNAAKAPSRPLARANCTPHPGVCDTDHAWRSLLRRGMVHKVMLRTPAKVIFLDVDGVMNNHDTRTDHHVGLVSWLDPKNVAVLNEIVQATGPSSSCRRPGV